MVHTSPSTKPSMSSFSDLLSLSNASQQIVRRDSSAVTLCRSILQSVYSRHTRASTALLAPLGPLSTVHVTSGFAHDQLWHQLDLRNKPLLKYLNKTATSRQDKQRKATHPNFEFRAHGHDRFFNEQDMNSFVEQAEHDALNMTPLLSDDVSDDGEDGEHTEEYDYDAVSSPVDEHPSPERYSDFFKTESPDSTGDPDTPLQQIRLKHHAHVQAIETANVLPRAWPLRGEVSAFARPKDSLLQTSVQHDVAVRPTSFVSTEVSHAIEDVVKQRILDGLFDDVITPPPRNYSAHDPDKRTNSHLPEISQQKPSEGLADLYAREFSEQREKQRAAAVASVTVQREGGEHLNDAQVDVNKLYEKLSSRLDALASLHFTHKGTEVAADTFVSVSTIKSIAAEEPVPDAVSDGDMLAAREVFAPNKNHRKGAAEMTKQDRRAKRRSNKTRALKNTKYSAKNKNSSQFDTVAAKHGKSVAGMDRNGAEK